MNKFTKLLFQLRHPVLIVVAGKGQDVTLAAIAHVLSAHMPFRAVAGRKISLRDLRQNLIAISLSEASESEFLARSAKKVLLVGTRTSDLYLDKDMIAGDAKEAEKLARMCSFISSDSRLFLNGDDVAMHTVREKASGAADTFGFGEGAVFRATDVFLTKTPSLGTNFKINHKGNIVPVWLNGLFGKEYVYASLAAAAVGTALDLHFVEVSQALAGWRGVAGKMKLEYGIKNTLMLDDSAVASVWSMAEGLEILGRVEAKRRIAVLGDVMGVGKYAIEAHESLGERVSKAAAVLFTVGSRAKFIAEGAKKKGLSEDNIFSFNTAEDAIEALKDKIQEGDFILVDGSQELHMWEIVKALKIS